MIQLAYDTNNIATYPEFSLTSDEEEKISQLASICVSPAEIAAAMGWEIDRRRAFCVLADIPGSSIAMMLDAARAEGIIAPQIGLLKAVDSGNVEAIREIQKLQARNRFKELVINLDDDEFTL